jgi:putative PIN family toxin of toxin-antitoxin system
MSSVKAVFDTNILISARLSHLGNPFWCLALAKLGHVQSVTCQPILDEFKEKLIEKFEFVPDAARKDVEEIAELSTLVTVSGMLRAVPDDPDDDVVIECAVAGGAEFVVSGDRHLLALRAYQNIEILSATEFLARLETRPKSE